ncbi:MAG TPA: universal stress protein [Mariprofundaceae bacterium]|nr:universal stress protein [Mariprofundaceae bacterium]
MPTIKRIVVPTDFSPHGRHAVASALEYARLFKAELHVLHVVVPQVYQSEMPEMMMPPVEDFTEDRLEAARKRLREWQKTMPGDVDIQTHVIESTKNADDAICEFADSMDADLIVIGSHGHTGLMHMLLGSTAEQVVRHAKCPVLVVKPRVPIT